MPSSAAWLARELDEFGAGQLGLAAGATLRIEALAQELEVGDAGDFDRILEAEEQPRRGALVRLHGEQVHPSRRGLGRERSSRRLETPGPRLPGRGMNVTDPSVTS